MKKRLFYNSITALACQIISVICAFVLPQLILRTYGSEVNGLLSSIVQFLSAISLLEMGLETVAQSYLFKPIAENDMMQVSRVLAAVRDFFNKIGCILVGYIVLLIVFYPKFTKSTFDWWYIAVLFAAIGVDYFARYFIGIPDIILVSADQRNYIYSLAHMAVLIGSTLVSIVLIRAGFSIQCVKLAAALVYFLKPVILRIYVNRHYTIDRKAKYNEDPIEQKYNGLAQHIAHTVLNSTDTVVLTVLSTLNNVSIYAVYHLVTNGLQAIVNALSNGLISSFGSLWVSEDKPRLKTYFEMAEWGVHTAVVFLFGCSSVLIVPFVMLYTKGVSDVDYFQPMFGGLLNVANAMLCLRLPYISMICAGGHFKQTQKYFIIGAAINVVFSVLAVGRWGLRGVAAGTFLACAFYVVWMMLYVSKHFISGTVKTFLKQSFLDVCMIMIAYPIASRLVGEVINYLAWVWLAVKVACVWGMAALAVNLIFEKKKMTVIYRMMRRTVHKNRVS